MGLSGNLRISQHNRELAVAIFHLQNWEEVNQHKGAQFFAALTEFARWGLTTVCLYSTKGRIVKHPNIKYSIWVFDKPKLEIRVTIPRARNLLYNEFVWLRKTYLGVLTHLKTLLLILKLDTNYLQNHHKVVGVLHRYRVHSFHFLLPCQLASLRFHWQYLAGLGVGR